MGTPWMDFALTELGHNVAEIPGPKDNPTIMGYYKDAGLPQAHETVAWCAAFANAMLYRAGFKVTGSLLAKSFLKYGEAVKAPQFGDIVVFNRTNNPTFGHVGFFLGFSKDGKSVGVLNGNVGDKVCKSWFPVSDVTKGGYRRPRYPEDLRDYDVSPEPAPKPTSPSVPVTKAPTMPSKPLPELIDELRKEGSRTINGADRIEKVVRRVSYWTLLAGIASSAVTSIKDAVGDLGEAANGVVGTVGMIGNHLWIIVPVLGFIVAYELDLIRFARADDAKSGKNTARLPSEAS